MKDLNVSNFNVDILESNPLDIVSKDLNVSNFNVDILESNPLDIGDKDLTVSNFSVDILRIIPVVINYVPLDVSNFSVEVLTKGAPFTDAEKIFVQNCSVEILSKYTDPEVLPTYLGAFYGTVKEVTTPSNNKIYLYNETTFELINTTNSVDGNYTMGTTVSGNSFLVCLDNLGGEDYNDLIIASVKPILY